MNCDNKLTSIINDCVDLGHEEFKRHVKDAVKEVILEDVNTTKE